MDMNTPIENDISIAYFSMEIALNSAIPTYAGGLGILAGDTLRSAADAKIAMAGVTLASRKGYFMQHLDEQGNQTEEQVNWPIGDYLIPLHTQTIVEIENREVMIRAWRYDIKGVSGHHVPVYLLDTDVAGNTDFDRTLTDHLYGGDDYYRLCQEVVLGIGGIRILRALGHWSIERYHMNEGHSSLLVFELLAERSQQQCDARVVTKHIESVRRECVFTTHTPVAVGHDRFPATLALQVLKQCNAFRCCFEELSINNELNLTHLALETSYYINGVARKHRETSSKLFEGYQIDFITNGIHGYTWASDAMRELFDRHIPDWRSDNMSLRYSLSFDREAIWRAHQQAKRKLIEHINKTRNAGMDQGVMTLGFARRATQYKRTTLIFSDLERLKSIASHNGKLQLIFAGKAHPDDTQGKELIRQIFAIKNSLNTNINIIYLADYDMEMGRLITAGVDLWLNTPQPPLEASGTSGMKAAINGVPSLSTLDGWWIEGCIEGVTGWSTSDAHQTGALATTEEEVNVLYSKLENIIIPMYYQNRNAYIDIMRNSIAINGSFFNTERMISQYVTKAYFR